MILTHLPDLFKEVVLLTVWITVVGVLGDEPQEGSVQLRGGAVDTTGNVMVYHNGQWGIVCDDGWSLRAADVVCKSLGYVRALGHTSQGYFGTPREGENFWNN